MKITKKAIKFPPKLKPVKEQDGRYFFTSDLGDEFIFPDLIEVQNSSYQWFLKSGISELLEEINPIEGGAGKNGKKLKLEILEHEIEDPKHDIDYCRQKGITYESSIRAHVSLTNLETGEIKEQDVYFGNVPRITKNGTFVINGIERVIVTQIVRSPGIFYSKDSNLPQAHGAKMIPKRGAWLELETDKKGLVWVKVDRKRKIPVTMFLRAFGYDTNEKITEIFKKEAKNWKDNPILKTLEKDDSTTAEEAWQGVYKRIRPGDLATPENAKMFIDSMFFDFKRYDLGDIARYKVNKKFGFKTKDNSEGRIFRLEDFIAMVKGLIDLNEGLTICDDDIDHLGNRRVRGVGELIQNKFRVGLLRTERIIKDRMTIVELENVIPTQLINCRPITASMREFFASGQLSQFMDQTNPLAALEHKRRISAMGPGGISRERASFEVRDVHPSHYGRICPVTTPEGPNIGLVLHLASYARVNSMGFIETPYRIVSHTIKNEVKISVGKTVSEKILDGKKVILKKNEVITEAKAKVIAKIKDLKEIPVRGFLTDEIKYYDAEEEKSLCVAQANSVVNKNREFAKDLVSCRRGFLPGSYRQEEVTHIDISPKQIVSISTSLIAFLEHDDNTRALMGSNMQRQAVPLVSPQSPIVGTGMERMAALEECIRAPESGEIKSASAEQVVFVGKSGKKRTYSVKVFKRTNQSTCVNQRVCVTAGQKVDEGTVLVDGSAVQNGEIAVGQNLKVAYMCWEGYNYEDAIIVSDRVVKEGLFNSIHIEKYELDVRDTKLGPEELTADIPNVAAGKLANLDEAGIVRIGATVLAGDILAGKVTPKGETELSAEDRLLRAIFGEKARDVKDSSLRLPRGSGGKVSDIKILDRNDGDDLPTGVLKRIVVEVSQMRHLEAGDKMAGRHGNKGVISKIVPIEDMPYMEDGTPVDIILNPLGVSSRMNIGQVLETHLGMAAEKMGIKVATPVLSGIKSETIQDFLKTNDLPEDGKFQLFDGKSGEPFDHRVTVGVAYILKLVHLVEDKIHARSVGPYSLVTQQPLGGKAQNGGQRFGEMEVWALEAYGAAHVLQEMLTIKSDDVHGRSKAYEAIVKDEPIDVVSIPESFNVLVRELQALCLKVDLLDPKGTAQEGDLELMDKSDENTESDLIEQSGDVVQVADAEDIVHHDAGIEVTEMETSAEISEDEKTQAAEEAEDQAV